MFSISRRGALFGFLAAAALPAPAVSKAFDLAKTDDPTVPMPWRPDLFGAIERPMGRPVDLFPPPRPVDPAKAAVRSRAVGAWAEMVDGFRNFGTKGQVAGINAYVNGARDLDGLARALALAADHWAAPLRFLKTDGDSERRALVKYASFRRLGYDPERLRMVWIADTRNGARFMVLALATGGTAFVLADYFGDALPHDSVPDWQPYCSFNENTVCLHWAPADPDGMMAAVSRLEEGRRRATT